MRERLCRLAPLFATALLGVHQPVLAQGVPPVQPSQVSQGQQLSQTNILYVSVSAGSDTGGNGSDRAPFKSITRALSAAEPNTTILLGPGTYSTQTGETFPLILKPNVTIQGDPNSRGQNILIQGGGQFLSPTSAGQNIAILAADGAGITGVTVTNPNYRGYGLWIESSSPTVANNTFTGNTHDGISVVGNSRPMVRGNYFSKNGANGITIFGNSQGEIRDNTFENTGFGINIAQHATPILIGNRITFNKDGIVVQASARPVLRGNYIERNQRDGIVAIAHSLPDLGTSAEPGSNVIRNNGRYDINSTGTSEIIPAYGNQLVSNRTVGRVDIAGTFRPVTAILPPLNRDNQPIVGPVGNSQPVYNPPAPISRNEPTTPRPLPIAIPPVRNQPAPPSRSLPIPIPPAENQPKPLPRPLPTPIPRAPERSSIPPGAVEIPVPTPENSSISPPLTREIDPSIESPSPVFSQGVLPVPSSSIPIGSGGYVPTGLGGANSLSEGDLSSLSANGVVLGLRYRVVVGAQGERELARVRAIAPGAFRTFLNGQSVIQAGAFREREKAEALLQMFVANGLNARIEEMK
ncbi:DUF1565 domain-containing protein [Kamptonema sp. UHCC 0994]|nr:DUF1565 domain-containing protein [Kamptonema sp. UHCC 0994]